MLVLNPSSVDSEIVIEGATYTISAGQTRDLPEDIAAQLIHIHSFLIEAPKAEPKAEPKKKEKEDKK